MTGQTLGHYDIESKLGAGGMGVVYRATDSKLGRQVAIKVLPEHFAKDPERLARFKREAQMLAALNHSNIATIHGLEESSGVHYLVLELVPGQTLAERLASGPLETAEALGFCVQIAAALEAAHDKGIIHRDLKPANVKITPEGKVKVLDFGLAKAFQPQPADTDFLQSPTVTAEGGSEGRILGTAAYISPEQARGKPLDKRTDIWSFGCVLYEALSRRRAFPGETLSDCVAAVLSREPDWEALPEAAPSHVRALLRRCLQKDSLRRLRDIGDARIELEEAPAEPWKPSGAEVPAVRPTPRLALIGAACLVVGAAAAGLLAWSLRPQLTPPAVARFAIQLPPNQVLPPTGNSVAISPDGTRVAFVGTGGGRTQIYVRELAGLEVKAVPGTAGGGSPFFSPNGQWLAFRSIAGGRTVKKVALSGGAPVTIADVEVFSGADWGADETILLPTQLPGGVQRVPAAGGTPQRVTELDLKKEEKLHYAPQLLPGGEAVLFSSSRAGMDSYDEARIELQVLATGERRVLVDGGTCARYSPTGQILYARAGALLAVPFDVRRLEVTGPPVPVLEGVLMGLSHPAAHYGLSANGTLVYAPGAGLGGERTVVWVDRQGREERLPLPPRMYLHPRISPDGRQIAIEIEGPVHDFYSYEMGRGVLTKMSLEGSSHWPVWTPDGSRITYRKWGPGGFTMWWMPADRSAEAERLTAIGIMQSGASWSPDGKVLAFTQVSTDTGADVHLLPIEDSQRRPVPFAQSKFAEGSPKFSPDGRWIAYTSNESGRNEIYVQSYPGPGPKVQVSADGGMDAVWKRNGGELYCRNGDRMMVVSVMTHPAFTASTPRMLWQGRYALGTSSACGPPGPSSSNYDVTPDGQHFLMIKDSETEVLPNDVHVVLNWTEELKRVMKEKKTGS
jgi:Tol biopolymer transport system component